MGRSPGTGPEGADPEGAEPAGASGTAVGARTWGDLWSDRLGQLAIRSGQVLLLVGAAAVVLFVLVRLRLVVVPLLIAFILAAAASPLVRAMHDRGVPRALAALFTMIAGLGILGGSGWLVFTEVSDEWGELSASASDGFAEVERFLTDGPLPITAEQLSEARQTFVDEVLSSDEVRTGAVSGAFMFIDVVIGLFLGVVILFFLLKDGPRIWAFLLRPFDGQRLARLETVGERSVEVLGHYVRGTALVALVSSLVTAVGLGIMGVPLVVPLTLIVFFASFIPLLGATVAGGLAALVALVANGPLVAIAVIVLFVVINQLEGDVMQPLVLGKAVSLHPLVVLVALTSGTILAGIIGALIAVPLTAVAWTAANAWAEEHGEDLGFADEDDTGPDAANESSNESD